MGDDFSDFGWVILLVIMYLTFDDWVGEMNKKKIEGDVNDSQQQNL